MVHEKQFKVRWDVTGALAGVDRRVENGLNDRV